MGSKQVPVGNLIWSLKVGGSWHLTSSAFRLQPFSLVSDLEERGCEICEGLPSGWNIIEKWEKENLVGCWKQCFLDTGKEILFYWIIFTSVGYRMAINLH